MIVDLHSETVGKGPAVLLVHGMGDNTSVWADVLQALKPEFACTTIDLPGHGKSPAPAERTAYERESVLASVDAVLKHCDPAQSGVVYVGHSLGGYLGLAHCLTRPGLTRPGAIRGLVLVAAGPGFRDQAAMTEWNERVSRVAARSGISEAATVISMHFDSLVMDGLAEVKVPVGLLVGSDDKAFLSATDYMQHKLPDVRRRTINEGRHRLMRSHPGAIAEMVREIATAAGLTA